jgi:hypothetical protein
MAKKAKKTAARKSNSKPSPKTSPKAMKKPAAKAASKPTKSKKPASKPAKASAKASAKKAAPQGLPPGTSIINTGSGTGPLDLGNEFVRLFNAGHAEKIEREMYAPEIVSVEGHGVGMAWHGKKAVEAKSQQWMQDNIIHGARAEGPYVGSSGFAVKLEMDVETRSKNTRSVHREIAVYTVMNGKIVREEFMYGM